MNWAQLNGIKGLEQSIKWRMISLIGEEVC